MNKIKYSLLMLVFSIHCFGVECGNESSMANLAIDIAKQKNQKVKKSKNITYKGFSTAYGYAFTVYYQNNNKSKQAWMTIVTLDHDCKVLYADGKGSKSTMQFSD